VATVAILTVLFTFRGRDPELSLFGVRRFAAAFFVSCLECSVSMKPETKLKKESGGKTPHSKQKQSGSRT
jgi:hypothetical protein